MSAKTTTAKTATKRTRRAPAPRRPRPRKIGPTATITTAEFPFAAEQWVSFPLSGQTLEGWIVEPGETDGTATVRHESATGVERFSDVPLAAVTPIDHEPTRPDVTARPRVEIAEGLVTVNQLADIVTARGVHTGANAASLVGGIYRTIKTQLAGGDVAHPFPVQIVEGRKLVDVEQGVTWWAEHLQLAAARAARGAARRGQPAA